MEKGVVASRGFSQITKLLQPGDRGRGGGANSGFLEKGIVAYRRKIQRGQTQGPGGATSEAWGGAGTKEKGTVASRVLSQIAKLGPPVFRGRGGGQQ